MPMPSQPPASSTQPSSQTGRSDNLTDTHLARSTSIQIAKTRPDGTNDNKTEGSGMVTPTIQ